MTNVGVAAHITAAARGGPRYDPTQTPEERRSVDNALWVCQKHAKEIDDDERRFTVDLLLAWRKRADELASAELGRPTTSAVRLQLIPHCATVAAGEVRQGTADFVEDIAARAALGRARSDLVRMVLYELALNATTHGNAASVTLKSEPGYISLTCDGPQFGLADLLESDQRGGGAAVRAIRKETGILDLDCRYKDSSNEWLILDHLSTAGSDNPCGIELQPEGNILEASLSAVAGCEEIHLYTPELWSFSDAHNLRTTIEQYLPGQQIVVHGLDPLGPVAQVLDQMLPPVRFTDTEHR